MDVGDFVSKHKWWIVGGIAGVGLLYILYASSTSSSTGAANPYAPTDAEVAAAEQLQAMQMQVNSQNTGYSTALQAQTEQDASQLALAKIQAQSNDTANTLAAQVANNQIQYGSADTQYGDTMQAQVIENSNLTQQNIANIQATNTTAQYGMLAGALTNEANIQANEAVTMNASNNATTLGINASNNQAQIALGNIYGQVTENNNQTYANMFNNYLSTQNQIAYNNAAFQYMGLRAVTG